MHNGMNSTKIVIPSQAYQISQYKNLRRKILKCCADIYFNFIKFLTVYTAWGWFSKTETGRLLYHKRKLCLDGIYK